MLASDFSFAQFRYVARLILVHGRSCYRRNVEVVVYSFYKNWLHNLTYIYFAFVTGGWDVRARLDKGERQGHQVHGLAASEWQGWDG